MLTVAILINGQPIMARSAVNKSREPGGVCDDGTTRYACDDGTDVWHRPEDGAIALAKKLLDTIRES